MNLVSALIQRKKNASSNFYIYSPWAFSFWEGKGSSRSVRPLSYRLSFFAFGFFFICRSGREREKKGGGESRESLREKKELNRIEHPGSPSLFFNSVFALARHFDRNLPLASAGRSLAASLL